MDDFASGALRVQAMEALSRDLPEFLATMQHAREEQVDMEFSLKTFPGDAELLYLCLWFAYDQGVCVRLLPKQRRVRK